MGSEDFYPEERPVHRVQVDGLWMDAHPVTNAQFRRFVKATGYVTVAERPPEAADYPDADPTLLVPGALVFQPSSGPVDLGDWRTWWAWVPGASWRHPEGPGSTLHRPGRPVVEPDQRRVDEPGPLLRARPGTGQLRPLLGLCGRPLLGAAIAVGLAFILRGHGEAGGAAAAQGALDPLAAAPDVPPGRAPGS
jgi:hypothetical protein